MKRKSALVGLAALSLLLTGCEMPWSSEGVEAAPTTVDPQSNGASSLNNRATEYFRAVASGDVSAAFDFFTERCKIDRVEGTPTGRPVFDYEQRWVNKMAYLEKTTDEIVAETKIEIVNLAGQTGARVNFNSDLTGISFMNSKWARNEQDNKWYLDSCRPPFSSATQDKESFILERERDAEAYRRGMIEDDGNYGEGVPVPENPAPERGY